MVYTINKVTNLAHKLASYVFSLDIPFIIPFITAHVRHLASYTYTSYTYTEEAKSYT